MDLGVAPPDRAGQVVLRDGRDLGWSEWGPPDGVPVLLCAGAATSRRLGFASDLVDDLGVLLVAVDRPGLGASQPQPGRTLLDWPEDVRQLCEVRQLALAGVVGFSQGGPFALAVAASGLVRAAAVVAGTDELARPDVRASLAPDIGRLVDAVHADAGRVEHEVRRTADVGAHLRMVLQASSPLDRQVYESPAFAEAFSAALHEALGPGGAGYARDLVLSMSPWPFSPADITVPVDLWYGEQDASPVHSPDHGLSLSRRLAAASLHQLPGAGGSLLWTHAEEILRALLARVRPVHSRTRTKART